MNDEGWDPAEDRWLWWVAVAVGGGVTVAAVGAREWWLATFGIALWVVGAWKTFPRS